MLSVASYTGIDDLLNSEEFDAAVIAVPTSMHTEVALRFIDSGKAVLIEKPVAASVSEAKLLCSAIRSASVKAAVGHVERFNPVVPQLIEELKCRTLYSINITRVGPVPPRIKDAGVLIDLSVHDIDLIRYLTGGEEIVSTSVYASHHRNNASCLEDSAVIMLRLKNGCIATITTNWLTPFKKRTIEVATDQSYFAADLIAQELTEYSDYRDNNSFVVRKSHIRKAEPLLLELSAFANYLETGDPSSLATVEDGLKTLEVLEDAVHSRGKHGVA